MVLLKLEPGALRGDHARGHDDGDDRERLEGGGERAVVREATVREVGGGARERERAEEALGAALDGRALVRLGLFWGDDLRVDRRGRQWGHAARRGGRVCGPSWRVGRVGEWRGGMCWLLVKHARAGYVSDEARFAVGAGEWASAEGGLGPWTTASVLCHFSANPPHLWPGPRLADRNPELVGLSLELPQQRRERRMRKNVNAPSLQCAGHYRDRLLLLFPVQRPNVISRALCQSFQ